MPGYSQVENLRRINLMLDYLDMMMRYTDRDVPRDADVPASLFKVQETAKLLTVKDPRAKQFMSSLFEHIAYTQGEGNVYFIDVETATDTRSVLLYMKSVVTRWELDEQGDYKGIVTFTPDMISSEDIQAGFELMSEYYLGSEDTPACQMVMWLLAMLDLQVLEVTDLYMTVAVFSVPDN